MRVNARSDAPSTTGSWRTARAGAAAHHESGSVELSSHSRTGESASARPFGSNEAGKEGARDVGRFAWCMRSGLVGESQSIALFGAGSPMAAAQGAL